MSVHRSQGPGSAPRPDQVQRSKTVGGPAREADGEGAGDRLEISPRSQEIHRLRARVAVAADVRSDRVEDVRQQVESGTYRVDPRQLAERLVNADAV